MNPLDQYLHRMFVIFIIITNDKPVAQDQSQPASVWLLENKHGSKFAGIVGFETWTSLNEYASTSQFFKYFYCTKDYRENLVENGL